MAIEIELFDKDGNNPKSATAELWATDKNMKLVESAADLQITTLRSEGKLARTKGSGPEFVQLEAVVEQILHPVPDDLVAAGVILKSEKTSLGKLSLDCIEPTLPSATKSEIKIPYPLSYCMAADTNSLVVTFASGNAFFRQQTGTFQSKAIATHLQIVQGKILRVDAKITKLETFTPQPGDFKPTADMTAFDGPVETKSEDHVVLGPSIATMPPAYPIQARERHISGSVHFDAVIGQDGHVNSLKQIGFANSALSDAAEAAVRQWVYPPFVICGIAVPVKTTINVNFNLN